MIYILVLLAVLQDGKIKTKVVDSYESMTACFEAREELVEALGRPIVNYQAVCVLVE